MEVIFLARNEIKQKHKIEKQARNNNDKVQSFFDIKEITETCIITTRNQAIYYIEVMPKNISVLSYNITLGFINSLSAIIAQLPQSEILCLNSAQNYDTNLHYLEKLKINENNAAIAALDSEDIKYTDNIRISMATSRIFFLVLKFSLNVDENSRIQSVNNVIQMCHEHNFNISFANKDVIKKMIAIYLEQNVYENVLQDYDGEKYKLDKDEYNLKDFVDIVAPSLMDFKHRDYYIIGNTFRSVWAIKSYKTSTEDLALLKDLGETDGVTLHIYNQLVQPSEQDKIFNKAERRNRNIFNSENDITKKVQSDENLTEMEQLLRESHKTKEQFIHCSVYIELIANSLEKLKELKTTVGRIITLNHIIPDYLYLQQRDGFASVCPFGLDMFGREFTRVLPAASVANLFPFSYSGKTDLKGLFIGKDVHGSNLLVDFDKRDSDKTNGHIAIFGNSGEGKSYLIKLLICLFRQQGKNLYSIDSDREMIDLTRNLGGTNLNMMSGRYFINFLEPRLINDISDNEYTDDEPVAFKCKTIISQHIAFLRDFFRTYNPELSSQELDTLEIMLEEVYKKFHITDNTNFNKLTSTDFPIPSDLFNEIERQLNLYDEIAKMSGKEVLYTKDNLRSLALGIRSICVGTDSVFFNGYTNIPNAQHINFDVKDLLNTNENLKNAMYFNILSFMQHKFLTDGNSVIVVDELHELIKNLIVILYLRSFVKRGRKKDSNLVIASQNLEDLMLPEIKEYTKPFFSIPTHQFLFYPGVVNIKSYINITNVTDAEWKLIEPPNRGHCLYRCGNERYHLHVIAPPHKAALFGEAGGR